MNDLIIKDTITDLTEEKQGLIIASFAPVVETLNEFGKQFPEIQAMEIGKEKCKKAKRFRIDFGKQITRADVIRKELKEESLKEGKAVQTVFNYIKTATEETKQAALDIELHFEKLEEEKRKRKQAERENELLKYDSDCSDMDLGGMDDTIWTNFIAGTKSNYEAAKVAEQKAEADRIEAEKTDNLHTERKNSVLDLWQFMPEENRNVNFGEWTDDMWNELVNYLYLAKSGYDKEQAKIKADNERLKVEADNVEEKRIADEKKLANQKKDRIEKYSKNLLEAGYQSDRPGVYVLGMYRVIDSQLETLSEKEFQDRLAEASNNHKRDLRLEEEKEAREKLEKEASDKATADKEAADRKAAAPDKEKMSVLIAVMIETRSHVKETGIRNYLHAIISDMEIYTEKL